MYYQNYEDYMRQVLGYPINDPNIYETYDYRKQSAHEDTYSSRSQTMSSMSEDEIRSCYPEIYHLVYPMVCKVCDTNTQPLTRELIEKMTDEVYLAMEDTNTVVNIRVETPKIENPERTTGREDGKSFRKDNRTTRIEDGRVSQSRDERISKSVKSNGMESKKDAVPENREVVTQSSENRQFNSNLRDLIKILILFRLFGNRPNRPRPPRPPFPGGPGPGRPPFPGGRPPIIQPRDYNDYLEF